VKTTQHQEKEKKTLGEPTITGSWKERKNQKTREATQPINPSN
jgi:hypothetical protein